MTGGKIFLRNQKQHIMKKLISKIRRNWWVAIPILVFAALAGNLSASLPRCNAAFHPCSSQPCKLYGSDFWYSCKKEPGAFSGTTDHCGTMIFTSGDPDCGKRYYNESGAFTCTVPSTEGCGGKKTHSGCES